MFIVWSLCFAAKLQLFLCKTNIKTWKHFDCNPKYFSQKKWGKPHPHVCVLVSLLTEILWFGNAATQGILLERFSFTFPTVDQCPSSAASSVVEHSRGPVGIGGDPQRRNVRRSHLQRQQEPEVVEVWLAWDTRGTLLMWNTSSCGYNTSGFEFPLKHWIEPFFCFQMGVFAHCSTSLSLRGFWLNLCLAAHL